MVRLLQLASLSFEKSCKAATTTEQSTDAGMLAAFNEFKSDASQILIDDFSRFETTVTAEVEQLRSDTACDRGIRLAIEKLHATIGEQVRSLRKSVHLREIDDFLRDFRESLRRADSLAGSVAKSGWTY